MKTGRPKRSAEKQSLQNLEKIVHLINRTVELAMTAERLKTIESHICANIEYFRYEV